MDLKNIRHHLHQHPEVSGEEEKTSHFIVRKLKEIGVDQIHQGFFMNSVLAEIAGQKNGNTILFRCELDALPIQEINDDLEYKSINDGVSHKCGHDGHMAILLGLAETLVKNRDFEGKIILLFQPAEEDGRGAKGILESQKLKDFKIEFFLALHNVPGFPLGSIVCKPGNFTPSVESLDVKLVGKTSHAGMPDKGISPAPAISKLIDYYQALHQPKIDAPEFFLSSPIQIKMGELAYGTAAGKGKISYTFRTFDHDLFLKRKEEINEHVKTLVGETQGLKCTLNWTEGFEVNINDELAYDYIKQAAAKNNLEFIEKEQGFNWGEDFGRFTQHYPGAMFGLGAGTDHPELHNPDYDFPDQLIDIGVLMFYRLVKLILS